jgi:hypothetical protein
MSELHEYAGVIHVHTAYSDSFGRMPYVIDCANEAGLDYVVTSDHNTLAARHEGWDGWHDGVLLVIGVEISSQKGHALVVGIDECARRTAAHPNEYLPEISRLGGTAFIAHPERSDRGRLYRKQQAWPDLTTDCYAGIEIWSYAHDWVDWVYPWHLIKGIRHPDAGITGPHPKVLRRWDEVALRRRVSGIGALDAHEIRFPIPKLKWSLFQVLPLKHFFRTVRTHVLTPEWSGDSAADDAALKDALAGGKCFTAYDIIGDATGARFTARRGGDAITMGDETRAGDELEFVATVPLEADIALLRNSEIVAEAAGCELTHRDARPGVYRVEARLGGKPWIFTNHIYVRCLP